MMAAQKHGSSVVATIIGIGALLFGAAGVFGGLQDALNSIWSVKAKPHAGVMGLIRSRFLSLAMVLGTGFLLLVSMALSTFLAAVTDSLGSHLFSAIIVQALNFVVSFAVTTVLFAMIFKYLPDVNIPFRDVWVGATGTALLFSIGKYFLALYLGRASTTSVYGAAGSVIVVLLWVYYASVILFFGAEFTRAFAVARGTRIGVRNYAMPASREMSPGAAVPADSPKGDKREITSPGGGAVGLPSPAFASFETSPSAHRFSTSAPLVSLRPAKFVWFLIAAGFASGLAMIPKSSRRRSKRA
jgi:membrane protein